jgi:nucleoprotein TPR
MTVRKSQCETVAELTNDLMVYCGVKERAVNELKAMIDSLTSQLLGSRENAFQAIARLESLTSKARRYQLNAKNTNANYKREIASHAEAQAALWDAHSGMKPEQHLCKTIESQLDSAQAEFNAEKVAWESSKTKLEGSLLEAKSRLDDMRIQNNMLHDQMASLSATVDKFQSTKASALIGKEPPGEGAEENANAACAVGEKQLSDLCKLLRF